jgi:hypothetical protein
MKHIQLFEDFVGEQAGVPKKPTPTKLSQYYSEISDEIETTLSGNRNIKSSVSGDKDGLSINVTAPNGTSGNFKYDPSGKLTYSHKNDDWAKRMVNALPNNLSDDKSIKKLNDAIMDLAFGKITRGVR